MKVFISADMEGVAGVVHEVQTLREGKEHERACKLMTSEVNAAIDGALEAGATIILVNDSHYTMKNILPEELHEEAELIIGTPKPLYMMHGIDTSFNAVFFIGYHARSGSYNGVLEHTISSRTVVDISINGKSLGETGINAAVAGYFKVPVVLVTGDRVVTDEARSLLGNVETVTVKEGIGRFAAHCLSPARVRTLIKEGARSALKRIDTFEPFTIDPPIKLDVAFTHTGMTDMAELLPGVKRINGRTVSFVSENYIEAFKVLRVMIILARTNI